ncbi:MAG: sensor histidine kinase [Flavobacteriales bacterium]|nr:sensor histidine kinase [Flavobacteriales bacterium]
MRLLLLILLFPFSLFAQANLDSIVSMPYDKMVSDLQGSKAILELGLKKAFAAEDRKSEAEIRSKLSTVTYLLGEHEESLREAILAISLFERLNEPKRAGSIYCSIGYQMKRRDMAKANEYMLKGITILEKQQDTAALESAYNNYGVLKEMENLLDSAKFYYTRSYGIAKSKNDSLALPYSLNHLAGVELLRENFAGAKTLFDEAYRIRIARKDGFGIMENLIFYGDLFKAKAVNDSAIHYYRTAIAKSYKVGFPYMRQYCYQQLAIVYENAGDLFNALKAQKAFASLKDSLLENQRTEQLAEMETRFETTQKEKENLLLKQESQEQQLVVERQRTWIFGLLGAAIAILFLGLFLLQRNRRMAEAKRDAAIIEERERGLRSIIQATEEERKRIAKDLHDGIVQSLTGLSLRMQKQANSEKAKGSGLDNELNSTRAVLDESIAEVRGISHQMMPRVLSEMGLIPALADMLEKSLGLTDIQYEFEHHNIDTNRFAESIEISLYRICQELVNNIIKHSEAKAVSVQLLKTRTHLVLVVEDNGKGFEFDDPNNQNGIGLMNITSRAKAIHGEVNYEPSPEQGTVATIRVPLG